MTSDLRIAIIGARGYAGAELAGLLHAHPHARLAGLFGSPGSDPGRFDELHPRYRSALAETVAPFDHGALRGLDAQAVFLATPPAASHAIAPALLEEGHVVFDLSAAFRHARSSVFEAHYGFAPPHPELLIEAVYALPELYAGAIGSSHLYALPGCYPTAIILAVAPLVSAGLVSPEGTIIADATSGVSGAGRAPSERTHFCGVSLEPYGVLDHRHAPEIETHAGHDVLFTPHLGPFDRGILATVHVPLAGGADEPAVRAALAGHYADAPFVRLLPEGAWPSVGAVRGTNYCDLAVAVCPRRRQAIVVSAIDNLLKGAAGQAVQVMNRHFGFAETAGLPGLPLAASQIEVRSPEAAPCRT